MAIDYYPILRSRIIVLGDFSDSARSELYRQIKDQENQRIAHTFPPMSAMHRGEIRLLLDVAIKRVEAEFARARTELGLYAPEWARPREASADVSGHAAGSDAARAVVVIEGNLAEPDNVKAARPLRPIPSESLNEDWDERLESLADQDRRPFFPLVIFAQLRIVGALLLHAAKTNAGHEKLAFLWLLLEPLMQVGLIFSLYLMFGRTIIYSMPAIPFAIIGVGSWLMFRTSLMRIAPGLGREFALCFYPGVTRLHVFLARSMFFGINYFVATVVMLCVADYLDIAVAEVKAPLLFLWYWLMLWLFSFGFALTMNYMFMLIPSMRRLTLVLLRGLYLVSAVVIVTEQLSVEDKSLLLWNPLVHGMQLLRSAYFIEYSSDDANPIYFLIATLTLVLVGLITERVQMRYDLKP